MSEVDHAGHAYSRVGWTTVHIHTIQTVHIQALCRSNQLKSDSNMNIILEQTFTVPVDR